MAIRTALWCNECGKILQNQKQATAHSKKKCIRLKPGDRVRFCHGSSKEGFRWPSGTIRELAPRLRRPQWPREILIESDEGLERRDSLSGKIFTEYLFWESVEDVKPMPRAKNS